MRRPPSAGRGSAKVPGSGRGRPSTRLQASAAPRGPWGGGELPSSSGSRLRSTPAGQRTLLGLLPEDPARVEAPPVRSRRCSSQRRPW